MRKGAIQLLKINNKANEAEIYISGDIVDDQTGGMISEWWENTEGYEWPKALKEQLDAVKGKKLTVYINSYGGSVPAGVAMANMISRHDGDTTAVIDGFCCSIATQIFFAAKHREMPSNAYLMIHKPSTFADGDANDMRKAAEVLDVLQTGLETVYQQAALDGVTAEEIHEMTEAETWLTGEDAAKIFDIKLLDAQKTVNCIGSRDALKRIGCMNIPDKISFESKAEEPKDKKPQKEGGVPKETANCKDAESRVKIAVALAKGEIER